MRYQYRRVETSILRADRESNYPNDWYWCTGRQDTSSHHSMIHYLPCACGNSKDGNECGWCYLGYGHTCDEHQVSVIRRRALLLEMDGTNERDSMRAPTFCGATR